MRHLPGQAAMKLWVYTHRLLTLLLALVVLGAAALGALAWRLGQGPLEVTWAARQIEIAVNDAAKESGSAARLSIGSAALVWEGFKDGVDRPLDIRLTAITATDASGAPAFTLPSAEVSLSIRALLFGRIEPRGIELNGAHLRAIRAADGTTTIDLGVIADAAPPPEAAPTAPAPPGNTSPGPSPGAPAAAGAGKGPDIAGAVLAALARAPETDISDAQTGTAMLSRLAQLRRIAIRDAALTVEDRQLGTTWHASNATLTFSRRAKGGADAAAQILLTVGKETARVDLTGTLTPGGGGAGQFTATLSPVSPAALADAIRPLAPLRALNAAVSLAARLEFGAGFAVRAASLHANVAAGTVRLTAEDIALRDAELDVRLEDKRLNLSRLRIAVQARPDGPVSTVTASGLLTLGSDQLPASIAIGLDRFDFIDLKRLWPPTAARGAQEWVTANVTAGQGKDANFKLDLTLAQDFADAAVTRVAGTLDAEDLTIHWLRPIPPFERARARLRMIDTDALEITTDGGRQRLDTSRGEVVSGISLRNGRFHVTGLSQRDQVSTIETDLAGPLPDVLTLLRHPRLHLLDRSPVDLKDPGGQVNGRVSLFVPLEHDVTIDDLRINAKARIEQARMAGIIAGRDLDQGALDLEASTEGMKIGGRANVANIPTQFTYEMDFRAGPPAQVTQKATASARADARQISTAWLDVAGFVAGPVATQVAFTQRRDGAAELRLNADLRESELTLSHIAWRKPPGTAATAEARLRLARDRILGIDDIAINGEAIAVRGRMETVEGRLALLRIDRAGLGRTQGSGTIAFQPGGRIVANLSGEAVDLAGRLTQSGTPDTGGKEAPGKPWQIDARFNTALMANGATFHGVALRAESDGAALQRLRLDGRAGEAPFAVEIAPDRAGRRLTATAADAGALLAGMDVVHRMRGGKLTVNGSYEDRLPDRPLSGSAEITDFRIANAPALARLLQMMTLYGLVEIAQGPGLAFTKLVAPFRMTDTTLELREARAFGPSLGLTLKGRLDRKRDTFDMDGTFVPAHFFNSLLGDIPVLGRLFAPEAGGGLVAFTFSLRGPLNDPQVSVNPLSALTPGFLRGLFNL